MQKKISKIASFFFIVMLIGCNFFTASEKDLIKINDTYYYKNTKKPFSGITQDFDSTNGNIYSEFHYLNGKRDGLSRVWWDNGQLEFEGYYKNGLKEGVFKGWYRNGKMAAIRMYKNGLEDGEWKI
ncbi:MAG: hypothetical protein GYA62_01550, partial [Bacteroidales bacterium]|nr:hypothetical protein [Bacteroidales bacterium]